MEDQTSNNLLLTQIKSAPKQSLGVNKKIIYTVIAGFAVICLIVAGWYFLQSINQTDNITLSNIRARQPKMDDVESTDSATLSNSPLATPAVRNPFGFSSSSQMATPAPQIPPVVYSQSGDIQAYFMQIATTSNSVVGVQLQKGPSNSQTNFQVNGSTQTGQKVGVLGDLKDRGGNVFAGVFPLDVKNKISQLEINDANGQPFTGTPVTVVGLFAATDSVPANPFAKHIVIGSADQAIYGAFSRLVSATHVSYLSIISLPVVEGASYHIWLVDTAQTPIQLGKLTAATTGIYTLETTLPLSDLEASQPSTLPTQIILSQESNEDTEIETILYSGTL